ncbi:MAG: hypothetical protein ACPGYY_07760 [Bacteroidia bacterium]
MLSRFKNLNLLELGLVILVGMAFYAFHFGEYLESFSTDVFFFNDPDDAKVYYWNTWHFAHQLSEGVSPFYTDYICTPNGTGLWMHAYTIWFGLLNLILGDIELSINLGIAIQLIVAFVGFYYLAKRFVYRPYFAGVVACVSVFNTYILAKCGVHYNLVLIGVLPFLLIYMLKLFPVIKGRLSVDRKHILGFLALLIIGFLMEYYVVFYAMAFLAVYLLWFGWLEKWFDTWNWKKSMVLVGLFGVGHIILRLMRIGGLEEKGAVWGAADFRQLIKPSVNSESGVQWYLENVPELPNDNKIFIGISMLIYLIVAIVFFFQDQRKDKAARFFLFSSVLFLMVTLPVIRIAGVDLFYNFTAIVHYIPFVQNVRAPDRFILMFFVTAVLFICRVIFLETNETKGWNKYVAFTLAFGGLFLVEHKHQPMQAVEQPAAVEVLEPMRGKTVLMLPFGLRDGFQGLGDFDENQMMLQTRYGFKLPSGYLSRLGDETWDSFRSNALYSALVNLQDGQVVEIDLKEELRVNGIDAVCVPVEYLYKHRKLDGLLRSTFQASTSVDSWTLYQL